jgi:hypothetical protein
MKSSGRFEARRAAHQPVAEDVLLGNDREITVSKPASRPSTASAISGLGRFSASG